jgi:hypothetical protein
MQSSPLFAGRGPYRRRAWSRDLVPAPWKLVAYAGVAASRSTATVDGISQGRTTTSDSPRSRRSARMLLFGTTTWATRCAATSDCQWIRQVAVSCRAQVEWQGSRRSSGRATGHDLDGACAVSGSCPGTTTDAGEAVGGRPEPSADLLRQLDDDPLRAADVAEPIAVFVALQLADEFSAAARRPATTASMSSTAHATWRIPGVFAGACRLSPWFDGEWNFVSSSRPWPSGVPTIAISARTPSSPTTRSTQPPSTGPSPYSLSPSSTKNAVAAARSSTTMPTCSIRWIVMRSTVRSRAVQEAPRAGIRRPASVTTPSASRLRHRPTCPRASSWDRRCSGSPGSRSNPTIPGTRRPDRSSCCPGRSS